MIGPTKSCEPPSMIMKMASPDVVQTEFRIGAGDEQRQQDAGHRWPSHRRG